MNMIYDRATERSERERERERERMRERERERERECTCREWYFVLANCRGFDKIYYEIRFKEYAHLHQHTPTH